jgi:hypothetical protein
LKGNALWRANVSSDKRQEDRMLEEPNFPEGDCGEQTDSLTCLATKYLSDIAFYNELRIVG